MAGNRLPHTGIWTHAARTAEVVGDGTLKPLASIRPALQEQLDANAQLMGALGLQATPAFAWRDASDEIRMQAGAPPSMLPTILGPR